MTAEGFNPYKNTERFQSEKLQGPALHDRAKQQLAQVVEKTQRSIGIIPLSAEYNAFHKARLKNFERLYGEPTDLSWATPRTEADRSKCVNKTITSLCSRQNRQTR